MTYTVQWTQYEVTEVEDWPDETTARERYTEIIADPDVTHAWIFDGPDQRAECIEEFVRPVPVAEGE